MHPADVDATAAAKPGSPKYQLIEMILAERTEFASLEDFKNHHRALGKSWEGCAREASIATGVDITRESFRMWFTEDA